MTYISAYDRFAPVPGVGSQWIWEPKQPAAREHISIGEVFWNGEEWWLRTDSAAGEYWNSLDRFWEAVGGPGLRATVVYRIRHWLDR